VSEMLKWSDYFAILLSFVGMLVFYLILSANMSINLGIFEQLTPLRIPTGYNPVSAWEETEPEIAVICGTHADGARTQDAAELLASLKKTYRLFSDVEDITAEQLSHIDVILITADRWDEIGDKETLLKYADEGKKLIFSHLMTGTGAQEWNKVIGVLHNHGSIEIKGILLSEKLMVQGMVYYDGLKNTVSDVDLDARCQKLMVEWSDDGREQKDMCPLIWEKRYGEGQIFVINGEFLNGDYGIGILTGLLSCAEDVFVYPVVNAKVNLLENFPELNNPYESQIQELYSRDTNMFLRDLVWPYLVKLCEVHRLVYSARTDGPVEADLERETQIFEEMIRRRGCQVDEGAGEAGLPQVCSGHTRNDESVFKMESSVSGMGLAVHSLDMAEITGKNSDDSAYEWNAYSLELSKLMHDLYRNADWVDAMTLERAQKRYERYLLLRPEIRLGEDHISIKTENFDEVCFYMIRAEKRAAAQNNCEVTQVGKTAYLVKVTGQEATVLLQDATR